MYSSGGGALDLGSDVLSCGEGDADVWAGGVVVLDCCSVVRRDADLLFRLFVSSAGSPCGGVGLGGFCSWFGLQAMSRHMLMSQYRV